MNAAHSQPDQNASGGPGRPAGPARAGGDRPHHPVVAAQFTHRGANAQLRLADAITRFAGSMPFVYLHAVLFGGWMILLERSPWPTLTLVVSLEAIFLSSFVMIGQNRQALFAQAKADHDFSEEELELKANTELTRQIHALTQELHRRVCLDPDWQQDTPGHTVQ